MIKKNVSGNVLRFSRRSASVVAKKRRREVHWVPLVSRRVSTMVDTWTEHLCVRPARSPGDFQLAVCGTNRGRLRPMQADSSQEVNGRAPATLVDALRAIDWPSKDLSAVQRALSDLVDAWPERGRT